MTYMMQNPKNRALKVTLQMRVSPQTATLLEDLQKLYQAPDVNSLLEKIIYSAWEAKKHES